MKDRHWGSLKRIHLDVGQITQPWAVPDRGGEGDHQGGGDEGGTVNPRYWKMAQDAEDKLIEMIDAGEEMKGHFIP